SVVIILVLLYACSEKYADDKEKSQKQNLFSEISFVANQTLNIVEYNSDDYINYLNPYEEAGIITHNSMVKAVKIVVEKKSDPNSVNDEFLKLLYEKLPNDLLKLNSDNLDPFEIQIEEILFDIIINEGFNPYIAKSIFIEKIILDADCLHDNQKKRILVFSTVLRYLVVGMTDINLEYVNSKGDWKDCFVQKLEDLQNCDNCYLEKVWCIFTWPQCLGFKALDCAIDVIVN
ncbi:MAG: hypothetical protein JSV24_03790, partial [Bacteroidales bacterium]